MLVGITRSFYRCISCGTDLEQYINGSIRYIPTLPTPERVVSYFEKLKDGKA